MARIWAAGGNQVVAFRAETWTDPATWGIMLVDFAKHIADAYERLEKGSRSDILNTIVSVKRRGATWRNTCLTEGN